MNDTKFTMNALLIVAIIFTAIVFFFTVKLARLADHSIVNEYYPIEGTDYGVRYGKDLVSGIYLGPEYSRDLKLAGEFGYDWGAAAAGDNLWINEYTKTDLGLMHCRVVRVDLRDFSTEILGEDLVLRGRNPAGELVCLGGCLLPVNSPEVNPLCALYSLTDRSMYVEEDRWAISPAGDWGEVICVDPETGKVLWRSWDDEVSDSFEEKYLLKEVLE